MSNNLGFYQDKYRIAVSFNNKERNTEKKNLEVVLVIIVTVISISFLYLNKDIIFSQIHDITTFIVYFVISYICCLLFHEMIHFIPLWLFSKERPQFGFLYVILRPNRYISKNKAFISYLLPFGVITMVFLIVSFLVNPVLQAALIVMGVIHIAMCSHDFHFSFRLYKCREANIALAHEKQKRGFNTIIFFV